MGDGIPSLNFEPGPDGSCPANAPCWNDGCSARRVLRLRPRPKASYAANLEFWRSDAKAFEASLSGWIGWRAPERFRYFAFGDIPDEAFLAAMVRIATRFSKTKFLVFTKRHDMVGRNTYPENLRIRLSMWPRWGRIGDNGYARAWLQDGTETRIPENAIECSKKCVDCFACWDSDRDVWFPKR